jgi:hypothetical protein
MNGYWVPHREARDFYGVSVTLRIIVFNQRLICNYLLLTN